MEFKNNVQKTSTMSKKDNDIDLTNITIMSTPRPQACSTVERKGFETAFPEVFMKYRDAPINQSNSTNSKDDSSLEFLENLSTLPGSADSDQHMEQLTISDSNTIDIRRQMARELLQKLSPNKNFSFSVDTDKENNANSQNLSFEVMPLTPIVSSPSYSRNFPNSKNQNAFTGLSNASINSVSFQPEEITARSSEMSPSPNGNATLPSKYNTEGFSFNSTAAELMAKFSNDDFLSASSMSRQLDADERSYVQNFCAIPLTNNTANERLEFSCFSGVMGDLDLSVESSVGRKVSVGEFFQRKCGAIGQLSECESSVVLQRPSFGLQIKSPERATHTTPLINISSITQSSMLNDPEKSYVSMMDCTKENDQDVISLSMIAQALEETQGTPRRLVDQLLMAKKMQKEQKVPKQQSNIGCIGNTYTVVSQRASLPSFSLDNSGRIATKLSLDSKTLNNSTQFESGIRTPRVSFENLTNDPVNVKTNSSKNDFKQISSKNETPACEMMAENKISQTPDYKPVRIKKKIESPTSHSVKKEMNSSVKQSSNRLNGKLVIGRNAQELYRCIVGITKQTEIEILNESDRWLMCSFNVNQIQGDQNNVQLEIPDYTMLIEPSKSHTISITVKLLKMGHPVIAALSILVKDMTTSETFTKTHMMCFVPEDPKIEVIEPQSNEINLNQSKTFSIKLCNKFDSNVPVEFFLINNDLRQFSFNIPNELIDKTYNSDCGTVQVVQLESNQEFYMNIQLNHRLSKSKSNSSQEKSTILVIRIHNEFQTGSIIKEILLNYNEKFPRSEIEIIDTELPMVMHQKDSKFLQIKNVANEHLILSGAVYTSKDSEKIHKNFILEPGKIQLESGESARFLLTFRPSDTQERQGIIRVNTEKSSYWYPVIGEQDSIINEQTSESSRCNTPQQFQPASSPSSRHSTTSNKSGKSSPRSSISGLTVAEDIIPIQATHSSLIWTTVKVGKYETREFTIRNTSNNKIKLQAVITDNGKSFKFLKDRESSSSIVLALQKMESKTFTIIFNPNNTGAAAGKITFKHYELEVDNKEARPSRAICLYGYGGYAKVSIGQALKIMGDQMWLSLGKLSGSGTLDTRMKLENSGDLPAYAKITLAPKAVYPSMATSWNVEPTEVILGPKESRWISIKFRPRKEDFVLLKGEVSDMGVLTITHGDEPTRWRIRRLYKKLSEAGQVNKNDQEVFRNVVYPICKIIQGETPLHNLSMIRDSVNDLGVLCRGVNRHVVTLVVELNLDETISLFQDDENDSQMFQSLCSDTSTIFATNEDSYMPSMTMTDAVYNRHIYEDEITVMPPIVTLNPPVLKEATIVINSTSGTAQPFETKLSHPDFFSVVPSGGMIPAKRNVVMKIQCKKITDKSFDSNLQIFTSNEKKNVAVKFMPARR